MTDAEKTDAATADPGANNAADSPTSAPLTPTLKKPCPNCPPLVVPRRGYTPARPSCVACVEKHLGAAYVLLAEINDMPDDRRAEPTSLSRRIRAIGHLFEAEDESQEWPELHNAIRNARRTYQIVGKIPDWEALAAVMKAIITNVSPSPVG
ncbi:MAG: hypothetical protein GXY74_01625 [Phycisphaerae bacterium]|nr:hypothetical protein [Phycisphaerae bacterium]